MPVYVVAGGGEWGHPRKGLESKALYLESQHQVYESCNGGPDEREKEGKEQRPSEKRTISMAKEGRRKTTKGGP